MGTVRWAALFGSYFLYHLDEMQNRTQVYVPSKAYSGLFP